MKKSQNKKILEHLQEGKAITTMGAFNKWLITRLSARIFDLRNEGHQIYAKKLRKDSDPSKWWYVYFMEGSIWFKQYGRVYK